MKLVPMTCSACGAALHYDAKSGMAHCPHCGTLYAVDDGRKHLRLEDGYSFGYDFERGRMKAQGGKDSFGDSPQTDTSSDPREKGRVFPIEASDGTKTSQQSVTKPKPAYLWITGILLFFFLAATIGGKASKSTTPSHTTQASQTTSSVSKPVVPKSDDKIKGRTTSTASTESETVSDGIETVSDSPVYVPPKDEITQDEVRALYEEARDLFNKDIGQHGSNEAFDAYDTAVEGLWTLSLDTVITESDLAKVQSGIESARSSYLGTAEQIEHEAARKQAEQERAEQERIAKEQAEQERIANIQASYVDPEVLLTVEGTLAHRSKALDLESSDLMKYFVTDTGAEEYFDAFNDWITLHEHYEFTKKYSEGPIVVKPGDRFYVSDQEMADATAHLRDLRRNMVVTYEIEHPEG